MRSTLLLIILISACNCKRTTDGETVNAKEKMEINNISKCTLKENEMIYQYLPDADIPEHLFTIILSCKDNTLQGKIFGPDPEGEHGLYFFLADLIKVKTDSLHNIEFEFRQGNLLTKQVTLHNYKEAHEDAGFSKAVLTFKGTNYNDSLVLHCTSESNECYSERMTFRLMK